MILRTVRNLAFILGATGLGVAALAFWFRKATFFGPMLQNLTASFVELAVGLVLINLYLAAREQQQRAALLAFIANPRIEASFAELTVDVYDLLGAPRFEEVLRRCGFRIFWHLISGYSGTVRGRDPVVWPVSLEVAGTVRRAA